MSNPALSSAVSRPRNQVRDELAQHLPQLKLRALKLSRNAHIAEDLVQETALRALTFETSYHAGTNLKAWLHQILFSVFMTRCRRKARDGRTILAHAVDPNVWWNQGGAVAPKEALSPPVVRALGGLPPHFGQVLSLVDLQELTYGEAAEQLGVPIGTVMSRLHRGRKLLARRLDEGDRERAQAA